MNDTIELAAQIRKDAIQMVASARASHIGGALSMTDLLAVLYEKILRIDPNNPDYEKRDRFILSKGHSCVSLYATLARKGFFPVEELWKYGTEKTPLMSHASHHVPGVEFSTGSLGHGLPFAVGKAVAALTRGEDWNTYVLLSDGEMDEGSNWEAFLFAGHWKLSNLIAIIDYNKIQSLGRVKDVLELEPFAAKIKAFGWEVMEVDGHNHLQIQNALTQKIKNTPRPQCVIAHTVKGKGVSYMEDTIKWHYSSPNEDELKSAIEEISNTL